jgi:hypothetical protein
MAWWIVVVVLLVIAWAVIRRPRGGRVDEATVVRTRRKDEGRGFGPTSP